MTNTVADPWAVVVHLQNTAPAQGAMVRSRWFDDLALLAIFEKNLILGKFGSIICDLIVV